MTTLQQQQYYYRQRQRQSMLNAYARQMMIAAQGAGSSIDAKLPNDKLRLVVETTDQYKKTGIYSAERNDAEKPIVIDWGDDVVEEIDGDVSQKVHEYASVGQFNVVVENIKSYAASAHNNIGWITNTSQNTYTLKEVVEMPESVTSISQYAFQNCVSLSSISIPNSITSIGQDAFRGCSSITSIAIDSNNPNYKFENNLLLTKDETEVLCGIGNIIVPASMTTISNEAFSGCASITGVYIPDSVTSIGQSAFSGCVSLKNVVIGNNIAKLNNYVFQNCTSLSSVTIGSSLIDVYSGTAFDGCTNLECFIVDENNPAYCSIDGLLLTKDGKKLIKGINKKTITVPDSVTSIDGIAFLDYATILSISIPNNVVSLGNQAFYGCSSLSSITCNAMSAPTVGSNTFGMTIFGTTGTGYTGRNTYNQGINKLYVPTGATGYDSSAWADPLQNASKCGFTIEYI